MPGKRNGTNNTMNTKPKMLDQYSQYLWYPYRAPLVEWRRIYDTATTLGYRVIRVSTEAYAIWDNDAPISAKDIEALYDLAGVEYAD